MASDRPLRLRLFDMLNALAAIERFVPIAYEEFAGDPKVVAATERWLEIISEASRHIPQTAKDAEPDVQWRSIADLGNLFRHVYDAVDARIVHTIATQDAPALRPAIERLYGQYKRPADPWP